MKMHLLPKFIAAAGVVGSVVGRAETPVVISSIAPSNGQIVINWTGGRANYQVQAAADLSGNWSNVGGPTAANTATIGATDGQAFFRVVSDYTASYLVVFDATWSQKTLPADWPGNGHFSGLVGGTHNASAHFWRDGEPASEGIRLMAEFGQQAALLNEITPAIESGAAHFHLAGGGIALSPSSVSLAFPRPMTRDYPLVTLVSMIAPSPDWFVGVDSLNMIEDGKWATKKSVALYGRDAGTDSGASFASPDQATVPRGVVTPFAGFPALRDGVIVPFGMFTFRRLD